MRAREPQVGSVNIVCLMRPKPENAETLRRSLAALLSPTRAETGCLGYDVYEEADGSFFLIETWRSQPDFAAHQQQPAVRTLFGERLGDLLSSEMEVHKGAPLEPHSVPFR